MYNHHAAIDRTLITRFQERVMGFSVDPLLKLSRILKPGSSLTVTNGCVIAHLGREEFILSTQPYELEADLEAFERLMMKRIAK